MYETVGNGGELNMGYNDRGQGSRDGGRGGHKGRNFGGPREMHKATCAKCQKECEVPFKPSGDRPVYCRDCFQRN